MFSTVLDYRQSLSEFNFCFPQMVTRSSARLRSPLRGSKKGFHNYETIPDGQGPHRNVLSGFHLPPTLDPGPFDGQ